MKSRILSCSRENRSKRDAFTLIELLIVVAIIAILAAIAVPNFLEAQTRARVSRVKADQRSMTTALESYRVDNNVPPLAWADAGRKGVPIVFPRDLFVRWALTELTTPIAYMTDLPETPFWAKQYRHSGGYLQLDYNTGSEYNHEPGWYNEAGTILAGTHKAPSWHLRDPGPDFTFNNQGMLEAGQNETNLMPYDPSNGTVSVGDIWKFGS